MQGPSSSCSIPGTHYFLVSIAGLVRLNTAFVVIVVVFVAFIILFTLSSTPVWVSYVSPTSRSTDFVQGTSPCSDSFNIDRSDNNNNENNNIRHSYSQSYYFSDYYNPTNYSSLHGHSN